MLAWKLVRPYGFNKDEEKSYANMVSGAISEFLVGLREHEVRSNPYIIKNSHKFMAIARNNVYN